MINSLGVSIDADSSIKIILPVGISFYTFTSLSYVIDIFNNKIKATNDVIAYLSYVIFFPAILSGPISIATTQLPQFLLKRNFSYAAAIEACKMILWGVFMKLCVADNIAVYVDTVYNNITQHNGSTFYLTSILYTIQIYADFAGYSLVAIGSGKLFGIDLQTNFIRPYFSKNVTQFWHKWHISLTTWFRDYIYFPMGGNRVSTYKWAFNTLVVFTVSGIWHGAAWTFVIWGAMHGIIMIIEKMLYGNRIKLINGDNIFSIINLIRVLFTFNIISFAWIFFRIESLPDAIYIITSIFSDHGMPFLDITTLLLSFMSISILFIKDLFDEYNLFTSFFNNRIVSYFLCVGLIIFILLFGSLGGSSFIYFQF